MDMADTRKYHLYYSTLDTFSALILILYYIVSTSQQWEFFLLPSTFSALILYFNMHGMHTVILYCTSHSGDLSFFPP